MNGFQVVCKLIIGRQSISNESNQRCRRSCGDKITVDKVYVKNSRIKILKPHAHLHIIGRNSTKFQANSMKDVGVAETSSLRTYGRTE